MKRKHFILLICLGLFLGAGVVQSAELRVAKEVAETGGEVRFKTLFSVVDGANLAGIKLVLHYNDGAFAYEKFEKSPPAKSMMHVVNDKNPGRLVVVMASATGQPEADYPLFSLSFSMLGGRFQETWPQGFRGRNDVC